MGRSARSDVQLLVQELRAIEMLAEQTEVEPGRTQDYWATSTELITLAAEIDDLASSDPDATFDDPRLLNLRRRLRRIAADLTEMASD
ncbi:MAG TPA: hypothetical protein VFB58_10065 [Chloroflexota bacterium]|nr:hypothetical protein [Chloroflexota bacterium]